MQPTYLATCPFFMRISAVSLKFSGRFCLSFLFFPDVKKPRAGTRPPEICLEISAKIHTHPASLCDFPRSGHFSLFRETFDEKLEMLMDIFELPCEKMRQWLSIAN